MLYQVHRPDRFDKVIGQQNAMDVLKGQVRDKRTGHAYLFVGSRGCGKTSTARIFSMAVNCENPQESQHLTRDPDLPCGSS